MAAAAALVVLASCGSDGGSSSAPTATTVVPGSTTAPARVPVGYRSVVLRLTAADGTVTELCALLAATAAEWSRGLMEVDSLGGADGMVFDFGGPTESQFYMLKTRIPLDVAFFAADGTFVSSQAMVPCPDDDDDPACPRYAATAPYRYALETAAGDVARLGIGPGSTVAVVPGESCEG